jgi:hypothetical protein
MTYMQRVFSSMLASVAILMCYPLAMRQMALEPRFVLTALVAAVLAAVIPSLLLSAVVKTKPVLLVVSTQLLTIALVAVVTTVL